MADRKKTTTDIVKKSDNAPKKERKWGTGSAMLPVTNPGDNMKYLQNSMEISELGTHAIDIHSAEQTHDRILTYFKICAKNDMKPSVAGLALAFGITRKRLWERANGIDFRCDRAVLDEYAMAYTILNAQMEDYMQNGKINPVSGIFLMKNNFGYKDKQEYVVTPTTNAESSPEELIREASQLPDDTDD